MKYTKPPKLFEEQADLILSRGLVANRDLLIMIPRQRKHPEWHSRVDITQAGRRTFAILTILRYLLRQIAPQSKWPERLIYLLEEKHPDIPIRQMGFPDNWKESPIWKG